MTHVPSVLALCIVAALLPAAGCDRRAASDAREVAPSVPAEATITDATPGASFRLAARDEAPDTARAVLMDMRVDARAKTPDDDADLLAIAHAAAGDGARVTSRVDGRFGDDVDTVLLVEGVDGRRWLLPVADDAAAVRVDAPDARALLSSPDTNGDGRNEVLVRYDHVRDGATHVELALLAPSRTGFTRIARFEDVRVDGCAAATPALRAVRIEYGRPAADAWPEFVGIPSRSACVEGRAPDFAGYVRSESRGD